MTPLQHIENIKAINSKRMKRLAKTDNKSVGYFTGMKSSIKDDSHTHEINRYMELR